MKGDPCPGDRDSRGRDPGIQRRPKWFFLKHFPPSGVWRNAYFRSNHFWEAHVKCTGQMEPDKEAAKKEMKRETYNARPGISLRACRRGTRNGTSLQSSRDGAVLMNLKRSIHKARNKPTDSTVICNQ
ncbi:hypothetical protein NDU88_000975 [Pleurodeles waltl]|uniref:Uncharacterized protein n=1 Tax=Pleurodeles waltl TaxID=8319 RepID=A0AAV7WH20_PLEWA|nr:hypothetical protein NDU88_000975 [Pleurodeles waltl]